MSSDEIKIQREYYASTADKYDEMHMGEHEHSFALAYMLAAADHLGIKSILDIGSGTGRVLIKIKEKLSPVRAVGVEPSAELRSIGHDKGCLLYTSDAADE